MACRPTLAIILIFLKIYSGCLLVEISQGVHSAVLTGWRHVQEVYQLHRGGRRLRQQRLRKCGEGRVFLSLEGQLLDVFVPRSSVSPEWGLSRLCQGKYSHCYLWALQRGS